MGHNSHGLWKYYTAEWGRVAQQAGVGRVAQEAGVVQGSSDKCVGYGGPGGRGGVVVASGSARPPSVKYSPHLRRCPG